MRFYLFIHLRRSSWCLWCVARTKVLRYPQLYRVPLEKAMPGQSFEIPYVRRWSFLALFNPWRYVWDFPSEFSLIGSQLSQSAYTASFMLSCVGKRTLIILYRQQRPRIFAYYANLCSVSALLWKEYFFNRILHYVIYTEITFYLR